MSTMYVNNIAPLEGTTINVASGASLNVDGSPLVNFVSAYANFGALADDSTNITISTTATYGVTIPIFRAFSSPKNITVDVSNNRWSHASTGVYALHMMYRQNGGGDVWAQYAVTKDGSSNSVGYTARVGSTDSEERSFHLIYRVDSTSSTYQLQGWCHSGTRTAGGTPTGNPGWTDAWGVNTTGTNEGRTIDIFVYKVGDL